MNYMQTAEPALLDLSFNSVLLESGVKPLRRAELRELQINLGKLCNQACNHCHVDAGPKRIEIMTWDTASRILAWAEKHNIRRVDITGGAPEMNPGFRAMVDRFISGGVHVTSRCNLSILLEPGYTDTARWYAEKGVQLVCSLPCYTEENVDAQRGDGVFDKSIEALKLLNELGYGQTEERVLDLVYNPGGAFLPPAQAQLESDYKQRLLEDFGIVFNRLLTITNLPISRFAHYLERTGQRLSYLELLVENFNPHTVSALMCRHLISVDWQGRIFDCDFNQMLDIPYGGSKERYLWNLEPADVYDRPIAVGTHCFGCTAGAGSSCGGALE